MTRTIPYSQQDFGYQKKNHWEQWRHGDITYKKPHDLRHHKIKLQVGVLLRHRYRWATDLLCLLPFFWHLLIWLWMSKLPKSAAKPRAFCEKPRSIQIRLNKRGNTPRLSVVISYFRELVEGKVWPGFLQIFHYINQSIHWLTPANHPGNDIRHLCLEIAQELEGLLHLRLGKLKLMTCSSLVSLQAQRKWKENVQPPTKSDQSAGFAHKCGHTDRSNWPWWP